MKRHRKGDKDCYNENKWKYRMSKSDRQIHIETPCNLPYFNWYVFFEWSNIRKLISQHRLLMFTLFAAPVNAWA